MWLQIIAGCASLGGAAILCAGCEGVAYTEHGTGVYYGYYYYPDEHVYYYPERHICYRNDDGAWHYGPNLPPAYHTYYVMNICVFTVNNRGPNTKNMKSMRSTTAAIITSTTTVISRHESYSSRDFFAKCVTQTVDKGWDDPAHENEESPC